MAKAMFLRFVHSAHFFIPLKGDVKNLRFFTSSFVLLKIYAIMNPE